jgi:dihydropyrimidinase
MILLGGSALVSKASIGSSNTTAQEGGNPPLLVRGGRIITEEKQYSADIRVRGEKIVEIGSDLKPGCSKEHIIDARGLQVLPGGIDPHAHLSKPWVDDYTSGSRAALAGGITTIGSMVGVRRGESLLEALERETGRVSAESMADIVLHPILSEPRESTQKELSEIAEAGYRTLKVFMVTDTFVEKESVYRKIIREAGRLGILTLLHCEDAVILDEAVEKLQDEGYTSLRYYAESRPVEAEVAATIRAVEISEQAGKAPVYVVHLSSGTALDVCRAARERGLPVYVETRPIYLHFTKERYREQDGPLFVGQPPLRAAGRGGCESLVERSRGRHNRYPGDRSRSLDSRAKAGSEARHHPATSRCREPSDHASRSLFGRS